MGWLDPVFVALTVAGYAGLLWVVLSSVVARATHRPVLPVIALTAACVWGADLIAGAVKLLVDRPRPFEVLPNVDQLVHGTVGASMPSGHAATSFAGAVVLGYLARRAAWALALLALAVAFSRVYVGVHYPSDVVAGAALGTAVAVLLLAALRGRLRLGGGPPRQPRPPIPG